MPHLVMGRLGEFQMLLRFCDSQNQALFVHGDREFLPPFPKRLLSELHYSLNGFECLIPFENSIKRSFDHGRKRADTAIHSISPGRSAHGGVLGSLDHGASIENRSRTNEKWKGPRGGLGDRRCKIYDLDSRETDLHRDLCGHRRTPRMLVSVLGLSGGPENLEVSRS